MKNPFNWAGNKYKYMSNINSVIDDEYETVYDVFMGSGNIVANIDCSADLFIGNDIIPLLPNLYNSITEEMKDFELKDLEEIINRWSKFSDKKFYYEFRDHWNTKYLSNNYDREFIYETIMLLKMCSNSMVRFNKTKGYFNQGFRGLGGNKKVFFTERAKKRIIKELNSFKIRLQGETFKFKSKDFKQLLNEAGKGDLVILDPPYILSEGMYGADFSKEDDQFILDFLSTTEADFILFNYLESGDRVNTALKDFLDEHTNLYVEVISEINATGQSRKNLKKVCEVMITNTR